MSDLIERQAAIDALEKVAELFPWKVPGNRDTYDRYNEAWNDAIERAEIEIEELSSAQPEQRWIPCSERLPEAEDCPMDCLVTRKSKYIGNYTDMAVCEKNGMWTHEDWDAIVLGDVKDGKSTGLISTRDDDIIAWMPLPEPWRGGQG